MREFSSIDEIIDHLETLGAHGSDENTSYTELDHGLQCAALLERSAPDDVELQIAGLLHDLAHQWDVAGQSRHGIMGADAVRPVLGVRVADLIEGHVDAKRYLVTTKPEYRATLSPGSIMTLEAQGSLMSPDEVARFQSHSDWESMLVLRIADDGAKVPGAVVPTLAYWTEALRSVAGVGQ